MRTLFVWLVSLALSSSRLICTSQPRRARSQISSSYAIIQVDLLLFYTRLGGGTLGESWSVYSYIQALGCALTRIQ